MNSKWYQSRKLWLGVGALVAVLAVALSGAALGLSEGAREAAIDAIKWLAALLIGGHAVTDAAASLRRTPE